MTLRSGSAMSYVVADCDRSRAKTQACPIRQKEPVGVVLCSTE